MSLRPDPDHLGPSAGDPAVSGGRTVRVVVGAQLDELVARKTGTNPAAVVAVEREALVLGQLRHPNVVDLLRAERDDHSATIVTQYAGRTTLQQERPTDAADVARIGAALLTVIGELHNMGWIHGRLRPEHCIVGDDGRLTLCALGAAHRIEPRDPRRSAELADAVEIIRGLVDRTADPTDRAARRRLRRLRSALAPSADAPTPVTAERLRAMLGELSGSVAVAVAATRADPTVTQPSARARSRRRHDDTTRHAMPVARPRSWRGAAVATVGLVALFGVVAFLRWVGGPLGLDGGAAPVRRLGDLPAPLIMALNVIRVGAFAACLYGIVLFAATLAAIVTRRSDVERLATSMAPPRLRQALVGLIGLGVIASLATGPGHAAPTAGPAPTTIAAHPDTSPSTTGPTISSTTTSTTTAPAASTSIPGPAGSPTRSLPDQDAAVPAEAIVPPIGLPNLWVMAPGDHLWGVAAEALARHYQRPATNREVDGYWRRLVELNRESLIDPDNADLVFAGQVIELPPIA